MSIECVPALESVTSFSIEPTEIWLVGADTLAPATFVRTEFSQLASDLKYGSGKNIIHRKKWKYGKRCLAEPIQYKSEQK